jgi:hypothetical protein
MPNAGAGEVMISILTSHGRRRYVAAQAAYTPGGREAFEVIGLY